jgi:hypothetical protein
MALDTYEGLKTSIADWLDRGDLTSNIPDFITLAEARISRDLRIRAMEVRSTATTTSGNKYISLPGGYLQMRNIQLNTNPTTPLEFISLEMLDRLYGSDTTGKPKAYSIVGDEIQLAPIPDSEYTIEMAYYKKFTTLGDGTEGTVSFIWLNTNAPDILLYASLLEAEPFLQNDQRIPVWLSAYNQGISKLQEADDKDRHSGSVMRVRNVYSGVEG